MTIAAKFVELHAPLGPTGNARNFQVVSFSDDEHGITLTLQECSDGKLGNTLQVHFDGAEVRFYRCLDEAFRQSEWQAIGAESKNAIFEVENSNLLDWFHEKTYETHENLKMAHFFVGSSDDCYDFLAIAKPNIEWIDASAT